MNGETVVGSDRTRDERNRGTTKVTQVGKKIKKEDFTGVDIVRGDM